MNRKAIIVLVIVMGMGICVLWFLWFRKDGDLVDITTANAVPISPSVDERSAVRPIHLSPDLDGAGSTPSLALQRSPFGGLPTSRSITKRRLVSTDEISNISLLTRDGHIDSRVINGANLTGVEAKSIEVLYDELWENVEEMARKHTTNVVELRNCCNDGPIGDVCAKGVTTR